MSISMIVDFHTHLADPQIHTAAPLLKDYENVLRTQAESGIDLNIMSDAWLFVFASRANIDRLRAMRISHDYFMKFSKSHQGRFMFMAFAYPFGGDESRKELLRALDDENCKGILLNTNIDGRYPDEEEVRSVFEIACDRNVPLFLHPPSSTVGADKLQQYHLLSIVGRPMDLTLAALRMILSGIMEEYKKMKVVLSYGGGLLPMLKLRIDSQCDIPEHRSESPFSSSLTKLPSEYIRSMYLDTSTMSKESILNMINVVGADHVLLGTDFPPGSVHPKKYIEAVNELPISDSAKKGILGENALTLLGMKQEVVA